MMRASQAAVGIVHSAVGEVPSIAEDLHRIPDRLVVLAFDDGRKSQATFVGPLLWSDVFHHRGPELSQRQGTLHDVGGSSRTA